MVGILAAAGTAVVEGLASSRPEKEKGLYIQS